MKKILYSLLIFIGIGIFAGVLYIFLTYQKDTSSIIDHGTPLDTQSGMTQSGVVILSLPVEMSGGVALDPYRHNSLSGSQRLYKGLLIMPAVEINLDCSTSNSEQSRTQCEKFKANIERTQRERIESNTGNLVPESTGTTSPETIASGSQI